MRSIINGRKYDTETAKEIGDYNAGRGWQDFRQEEESLYRKKNGEFFLAGRGGPLSKYGKECPTGGWDSGSRIIPITEEEARKWVETNMTVDDYEEIFGEVKE